MPEPAELIVIRHGQSVANAAFAAAAAAGTLDAGVDGPDADVPLSDLGRWQAADLGRWLAGRPTTSLPEVVFCSPYRRAVQTWRIAIEASGVELPDCRYDERLVDHRLGVLELMTRPAIEERYPAEAARWRSVGEYAYRPPGGESLGDVVARTASLLTELRTSCGHRRVLIVAHDATVLAFRQLIEHIDPDQLHTIPPAINAGITTFHPAPPAPLRLTTYNIPPPSQPPRNRSTPYNRPSPI